MPNAPAPSRATWPAAAIEIAGLTTFAAGIFLLIARAGRELESSAAETAAAVAPPAAHDEASVVLFHVLLVLAAVIAVGRALGWLCRLAGQPAVMGEVIAGILLGPSLLGRVAPQLAAGLLPPSPSSIGITLGVIAQMGVILYMFTVGLELDFSLLRARARSTLSISHASIVAPFLLGAALSLYLYPREAAPGASFFVFSLFMGASMSVTAFPLLARILTDRRMTQTPLGVMALSCAAANDAAAWCLLALLVGVAQGQAMSALYVVGLTLIYMGGMFVLVRPIAARVAPKFDGARSPQTVIAWIFVALLLSALATETIGVHAIFGAFVLGAVIPHDSELARELRRQLEGIGSMLLLPAFFAYTGMRTQLGLISGWENWLACGLIVAAATAGKFGGTLLSARLTGAGWRQSAMLGALMNTRGLMELIILNIGLDLGAISPTLFAMMVVMALATTFATTPILQALGGDAAMHGS